jgi:F-type H+-transporting ATPase subunit gamma
MTRRHALERHRQALVEIREIMNSMKTLAYMETRKLRGFLEAQHNVVQSIEEVAADLLSFYPRAMPASSATRQVCFLIGTERGFCGDFNHVLLREMQSAMNTGTPSSPLILPIGRKLYSLLEDEANVVARIDGATVVEEVTAVLSGVLDEFSLVQKKNPVLNVLGLYHDGKGGMVKRQLLPPFSDYAQQAPRFSHPPVLNQDLHEFLAELTDHYLFAVLHEILYASLMAENLQRVSHLEGAMKHLDDKTAELTRQSNSLRQAEIIEEIEINLLSAGEFAERAEPEPGTPR